MKNSLISLLLIIASFQAQAQIADKNGCVKINDQRAPEDFVSDLENGIFFDIGLQEHLQKSAEAEPEGVWYQSEHVPSEHEAPEWALTIPDLNDRIEQWRVINRMSPAFEEECGLNLQPSEKDIDSSLSDTDATAALQDQSLATLNKLREQSVQPKPPDPA